MAARAADKVELLVVLRDGSTATVWVQQAIVREMERDLGREISSVVQREGRIPSDKLNLEITKDGFSMKLNNVPHSLVFWSGVFGILGAVFGPRIAIKLPWWAPSRAIENDQPTACNRCREAAVFRSPGPGAEASNEPLVASNEPVFKKTSVPLKATAWHRSPWIGALLVAIAPLLLMRFRRVYRT
eukprot:Hpha_TRINITY_DN28947_c0_g1::TRINITY_DN28947_c0_g1_i1::g.19413::m.19413